MVVYSIPRGAVGAHSTAVLKLHSSSGQSDRSSTLLPTLSSPTYQPPPLLTPPPFSCVAISILDRFWEIRTINFTRSVERGLADFVSHGEFSLSRSCSWFFYLLIVVSLPDGSAVSTWCARLHNSLGTGKTTRRILISDGTCELQNCHLLKAEGLVHLD